MTGRPIALVMNPAATKAGRTLRAEVVHALGPLGLVSAETTRAPGDARRLAREAAAAGAAVVVTLGGDGTAADVAGELAGGPVAMAPLPGGNANVFARALGWPNHLRQALGALTVSLASGAVREARLGRVSGDDGLDRVFAINTGVGIDAATVEWIEARPRTKHRLRQAGFAAGAAIASVRAGRAPRVRVDGEGIVPVEGAMAVLVATGTPYTYLGRRPLDLVPGAAFDGGLAWIALTRMRPHELAQIGWRALNGRELPMSEGGALAGGPAPHGIVGHLDVRIGVGHDGEPLGRHLSVRVGEGPLLRVVDPRRDAGLKSEGTTPT